MEPKELLKKYMEGEMLTVEENEELNNWVVAYMHAEESEQQTLQGQFFYEVDGETKVINVIIKKPSKSQTLKALFLPGTNTCFRCIIITIELTCWAIRA